MSNEILRFLRQLFKKRTRDIVIISTPRSGSHHYLTDLISPEVTKNRLNYQNDSGELFNLSLTFWHNPHTGRIWVTDRDEQVIKNYRTKYIQLSDNPVERIEQLREYKKVTGQGLIYSVHPFHIDPNHEINQSFFDDYKQFLPDIYKFINEGYVVGLTRKNKVGQVFSWLKYNNNILEAEESDARFQHELDFIISQLLQYNYLKHNLRFDSEINYEDLTLPDNFLKELHSNPGTIKNKDWGGDAYQKLPTIDYKNHKHYPRILNELYNVGLVKNSELVKKKRILVTGGPDTGKTTFAQELLKFLKDQNKDVELFTEAKQKKSKDAMSLTNGQYQQGIRMVDLSWASESEYVICEFTTLTDNVRKSFKPDYLIWLDTGPAPSNFDTIDNYDFRIITMDFARWANTIGNQILNNKIIRNFDVTKETVQMLIDGNGWSTEDRKKFDELIKITGQVQIQIRANDKQDIGPERTKQMIIQDLASTYFNQFDVILVANLINEK